MLPTSSGAAAAKSAAASAKSTKTSATPTAAEATSAKSAAAHPGASAPIAAAPAAKEQAGAEEQAEKRASAEKEEHKDEKDELAGTAAVLLNRLGRVRGLFLVQRDFRVVGDYFCNLAHRERYRAVIIRGLQVGNHVAADVAGFAIRQDPFQPVADLDAVFVVGNGQEHHGVLVLALVAHLPVIFKLVCVVSRVVAVEVVHRDDGDLRVGLRVVELRTDRVQPRDCVRRQHVRKIAHVVSGLGQACDGLGARGDGEECKKSRQQWRNHGEMRAAKASHSFFIVR